MIPASIFLPLVFITSIGVYLITLRFFRARPNFVKYAPWLCAAAGFVLGMAVAWDIGLMRNLP